MDFFRGRTICRPSEEDELFCDVRSYFMDVFVKHANRYVADDYFSTNSLLI